MLSVAVHRTEMDVEGHGVINGREEKIRLA